MKTKRWLSTAMAATLTLVLAPSLVMFCAPTSAMAQGVREVTCEIFSCTPFKDLVAAVTFLQQEATDTKAIVERIETKVDAIVPGTGGPDHTEQLDRMENILMDQNITLAEIQETVNGITIPIPDYPDYSDELTTLDVKLDNVILWTQTPEASIWLEASQELPATIGETGDLIITIWMKGESLSEIKAWGLDMAFPVDTLQYEGYLIQELNSGWAGSDANEVTPGTLRMGGFAGAGAPIVGTTMGRLAAIRFNVLQTVPLGICIQQYVDGVANLNPAIACITVVLQ